MNAIVEWIDPPDALGAPRFEWLAAGPGDTRVYCVDLPSVPIDTPIGMVHIGGDTQCFGLPTQALVGDAVGYLRYWVPTLVDDAAVRVRDYIPIVGPELVNSAWPTLQAKLEEELPRLVLEAQPEVQKIQRRFELALGIFAAGIIGFVWWRTR